MSAVLGLLAVLVLTAGTGYFVAQEFAYVAADRLALAREAAAGDKRAARAVKVLERLSFMLSGAQLGITVTGLVVGFLAEPALAELLRPLLSGAGIPDAAVSGIALTLAFALATVIQMVLGELAPKNLALAIPERLAKSLGASTLAYLTVAGPVIRVFDASANKILRRVGIEPVEELHHGATLEELGHLIGESHDHGQLPRATADLLESALEFSERRLAEVMVPRVDVDTVPEAASGEDVALLIARRGHSHYPVIGQRTDDVVGVVGVRELMPLPAGRLAQQTSRSLARPALFLPDSLSLPRAVEQMETAGEEFAVVLDEHGGLAGIVTFEDIAEELVGEIADESDRVVPLAVRDGDGWLIDAGRRIDEAAEATGIALSDEEDADFETVAGLVIDRLGRLPVIGDQVTVDLTDGHRATIEVTEVDRHVPERIYIKQLPEPVPGADRNSTGTESDRSKERPA
ncbi:hemolysin family protein [Streptomyces sp. CB03238]|uniref:hemolysin family protein n=1 Tax=Streptomyces sp. CB03238 TaxID=1907777 RepID=UPI000A111E0C|nr:hemolysin family protein [Streptomyces sp. CB03238]ORT58621.1 hypothetical protein BKD26_18765 [Streptomyces sp. CB03238]